ncbi:MAG: hypothetical protein WCT44_02195 [Candidatus Paceibacterota bacterium]
MSEFSPENKISPPGTLINNAQALEALREYLSFFSKHLYPPYIYELPSHTLTTEDANYYHYMCRGNAVQVISGFMNIVVDDADILRLTNEQKIKIKEMENSLLEMKSGSLRTPEDMVYLKNSIQTVVDILTEQERKLLEN